MQKEKLTLYIDKEINKLAHLYASLEGKSISSLVRDYFIKKSMKKRKPNISKSVSKWIGILNTKKSYKELRDEYINSKVKHI